GRSWPTACPTRLTSTRRTCGGACRASRPMPSRATRRCWRRCGAWPGIWAARRASWRWPGCCIRGMTSFPFPAPRGCRTWMRISGRLACGWMRRPATNWRGCSTAAWYRANATVPLRRPKSIRNSFRRPEDALRHAVGAGPRARFAVESESLNGASKAMQATRLGLIGYGEVGGIFCAGLKAQVDSVHAWDTKLADAAASAPLRDRAARDGVILCDSAAALCAAADLVISAVTASNTVAVARKAAAHLRPGTVFLDLNSASPGAKREAAGLIEAAGGHYVEAGVMTSVPPYSIRVPMLLGGPHAETLAQRVRAFGMGATAVSPELG